ncbi:MAG: hypothetical protein HY681_11920 [Chloroflexi bacterium]|nr:hypothetical protein [Chloroflexota bacterium]
MGVFQQLVEIGTPDGSRFLEVQAWVDSGENYSQLPAALLRRLGFKPTAARRFRVADGRTVERGLCPVPIRLNGEVWLTPVVFGENDSDLLLGAVALETFSLGVDPVNKTLVPIEAKALGIG